MATNTEAQAPIETTSNPAPATVAEIPINPAQARRDELESLLENPEWTPEGDAAAPAESKATETETPPADPPTGEQPSVARPEGDETPQRFRFTDPADRKFAVLRKEGVDPAEAARIAYGLGKTPEEAPMQTEPAGDELAEWNHQLADVDRQLVEAGVNEGLMNAEIVALLQRRTDLAADIRAESRLREREAREQSRAQAEAVASIRASHRSVVAEATQRFPGIAAEGTALRVEADRLTGLYQGTHVMQDPQAPMIIAEQAAVNVAKAQAKANGTSMAVELDKLDQGAKPGAMARPEVAKARKITPASGAHGTQRPDKLATEEDKFSDLQGISDPRARHARLEELLYAGA